jgi:hypothetical protein
MPVFDTSLKISPRRRVIVVVTCFLVRLNIILASTLRNIVFFHLQISTADLDQNGDLELIVTDNSANVICLKNNGQSLWEAEVSGTSSPGAVFGDIDGNDVVDVVITTNDG